MKLFSKIKLLNYFLLLAAMLFLQGGISAGIFSREPVQKESLEIDRRIEHRNGIIEVIFENGLRLFCKENKSSPAVSIKVFVKIGSIYEGEKQGSGISHYFEHIISGGTTRNKSEEENKKILESIGNNSNAYTTRDHTAYYITTENSYAETAINLLADYMANCAVNSREFERERGVIIQEIRKGQDSPQRQIHQLLNETMFPSHPAGLPVIGYEELFKKVTRDEVEKLYDRYYVANNSIVVIVGNIPVDESIKFSAKAFAGYKRGIPNHPAMPEVPEQISLKWAEKESPNVRKTYMLIGHHTVTINHPDLFALDILSQIMGGGRSSRLYKALRIKGLVQTVYSYSHTPKYNAGNFVIGAVLDTRHLGKVQQVILDEIIKLQEEGVTKEELRRAYKQVASSYTFGLEEVESQASDIGRNVLSTGDPNFTEKYLDGLRSVTREQVAAVAKKYLTTENRTVALLKPETKKQKSGAKAEGAKPSPQNIEKIMLKNGLRVIYGYDPNVQSALVQLSCLGGVMSENKNNNGICRLMSSLLMRGTRDKTGEVLHAEIEGIGGKVYSGSGNNSWYAGIKVMKEDFDKGMSLLSEIIMRPRFDKDDFEAEKIRQIQIVRSMDDSWEAEASRFFRKRYFKGHPYALDPMGNVEALTLMTAKDIKDYYRNNLSTDNSVLAIFGNIKRDEAVALAEKYFMVLPLPLMPEHKKANKKPKPDSGLYLKENNKNQAVMIYGFKGEEYGSKDIYAIDILDTIISGYGYPAGWLHDSLRGRADLVYLVHAYNWAGLDTGVFQIITQTSPDNVRKVMSTIEGVLKRAVAGKINEEEFQAAKQILIINNTLNRESLSDRATQSSYDELYGKGFDYFKHFEENVAKVKLEDVVALAKDILERKTIVATGNKDALKNIREYFSKLYPENADKIYADKVSDKKDDKTIPAPEL